MPPGAVRGRSPHLAEKRKAQGRERRWALRLTLPGPSPEALLAEVKVLPSEALAGVGGGGLETD